MAKSKAYENYVDWVRDAHAMEKQAEIMLTKMAGRLEHYPRLRARITQHITETQEQQRLVESVLERLDKSSSVIKDTAGKMSAIAQAFVSMFASDEIIKDGISGYVFAHFEIASYATLVVTAEAVGDLEGAQIFRRIKVEEEKMAKWLAENLPSMTKKFLSMAEISDKGENLRYECRPLV